MFFRRKFRSHDEEPLVPHGLVWHATGESSARDDKGKPTVEAKAAKVVEMAPAVAPPAQPPAAAPEFRARKPVSSIPPFWHSVEARRLARLQPSREQDPTPPPVPVQIAGAQAPSSSTLQKSRALVRLRLDSLLSAAYRSWRSALQLARRAEARSIAAVERWHGRWQAGWRTLELQMRAGRVLDTLASAARRVTTAMGGQSARLRAALHAPGKMPRLRPLAMGAIFSALARQVRALPWRPFGTALKGSAVQMEILTAREAARWRLHRPRLNFRNVASRAMPLTLPTLAMLAVLFAVRHYATKALPSHRRAVTPAEKIQPPAPVQATPARHELRARPRLESKQTAGAKRSAAAATDRRAAGPRGKQGRGDEDYVAPDSYVYYGQKGK